MVTFAGKDVGYPYLEQAMARPLAWLLLSLKAKKPAHRLFSAFHCAALSVTALGHSFSPQDLREAVRELSDSDEFWQLLEKTHGGEASAAADKYNLSEAHWPDQPPVTDLEPCFDSSYRLIAGAAERNHQRIQAARAAYEEALRQHNAALNAGRPSEAE